jgi:hypothetical protein
VHLAQRGFRVGWVCLGPLCGVWVTRTRSPPAAVLRAAVLIASQNASWFVVFGVEFGAEPACASSAPGAGAFRGRVWRRRTASLVGLLAELD